jgi:hypothetical protein
MKFFNINYTSTKNNSNNLSDIKMFLVIGVTIVDLFAKKTNPKIYQKRLEKKLFLNLKWAQICFLR